MIVKSGYECRFMHTDDQVISRIRKGNSDAKRVLYDRHEAYWFKLCLRYARNRPEAQDMFQEGVIKVFAVLDTYRVKSNTFKAWSNRVVINAALKYLKKHHWKQTFDDITAVENLTEWNDTILNELTAKEIVSLIQELPAGYRTVFNMHDIDGYTHREIAERLDISVGTSKSQLAKAKKLLRSKFELLFK